MSDMQLGVVESKFADLLWKNEPITSAEVVRLCARELEWKKSTTFTVLRRLCEKGIFQNEGGRVTSLISRAAFYAMQSERFVAENFGGSLPAFLAAFTTRKRLSKEEAAELRRMVEAYTEEA